MEDYEKKYKDIVEKFDVVLNLDNVKESGTISVEDVRKIISELAESEDEKMKKALIRAFRSLNTLEKWNGIPRNDIIDWLEKQKSIDVLDEEEREFADNVDSYRKDMDDSYQKGYDEGIRVTLENQKPRDWTEKDKDMVRLIGNAITTEEASNYLKEKNIEIIDAHVWLDRLQHRCVSKYVEKEWSDEDDTMLRKAITAIDNLRFNSEFSKQYYQDISNWLIRIKPQESWKPTKEQLEQLHKYCPDNRLLTELYNDLKKLTD